VGGVGGGLVMGRLVIGGLVVGILDLPNEPFARQIVKHPVYYKLLTNH
jgi:hypothetical protein